MHERERGSQEAPEREAEPFEGEGGKDTGSPTETTRNVEQSDEDEGTGANNQGAVQRPDLH